MRAARPRGTAARRPAQGAASNLLPVVRAETPAWLLRRVREKWRTTRVSLTRENLYLGGTPPPARTRTRGARRALRPVWCAKVSQSVVYRPTLGACAGECWRWHVQLDGSAGRSDARKTFAYVEDKFKESLLSHYRPRAVAAVKSMDQTIDSRLPRARDRTQTARRKNWREKPVMMELRYDLASLGFHRASISDTGKVRLGDYPF